VRIATGDIVPQHIRAIVNPGNSHLNHFRGVACAIADAAGNDLINECETYRQEHGLLPTTGVTHTTAGRLRPGIEYVVHTIGPRDIDYPNKTELQIALTTTFYNTLKYASETLRIPDLCLSAISSGIFKVTLESVVRAFYTALTLYTDEYSRTSHTPILQSVCLINICADQTATTAQLFRGMYNTDRPTPASDTNPPQQTVRPSGRQANRRARAHTRVEERMEVWTPAILRQRQEEDHDIKSVIQWMTHNDKPDWNTVRAQSPALKVYWHQWDSLCMICGILYRQLEPLTEANTTIRQLLLPRVLRTDFLTPYTPGWPATWV